MRLKPLIYGIATFIPGVYKLREKGTGGSDSARYCYTVWLRHLISAHKSGMTSMPNTVAELGPGDSLGMGLAALLSGCGQYFALDLTAHAHPERNLEVFEALVQLFRNREPLPNDEEFPGVFPKLDTYDFPDHILSEEILVAALQEERLEMIRASLKDTNRKDSLVVYKAPWFGEGHIEENSVDMIFSQAVLEHIDQLRETYRTMKLWLKEDGFLSHVVDFYSHNTAHEWNGHWAISDFMWFLIRGRRPYLLNRQPCSSHLQLLEEEGWKVIYKNPHRRESNLTQQDLKPRFRAMSDEDLTTRSLYFIARKS